MNRTLLATLIGILTIVVSIAIGLDKEPWWVIFLVYSGWAGFIYVFLKLIHIERHIKRNNLRK